MGLKEQFTKLKDNWLLILIVLVVLMVMSGIGRTSFSSLGGMSKSAQYLDEANYAGYSPSYGVGVAGQDFAPEVKDRLILKTLSMNTEVKRGTYADAVQKVKNIVSTSDSFILNENDQVYGTGRRSYQTATYQIKVESTEYDAVVAQLKAIGEVKSFQENALDVTGKYVKTDIEIDLEKSRLLRYQQMYDQATIMEDKITLNDRIFDQERTIKYLEDSLTNLERKVEYTTISLSLTEKQSDYFDVVWVRFSELVRNFVSSINGLFRFVAYILPWLIAFVILNLVWKLFRRNRA